MSGHGEKLSRLQARAVGFLLEASTLAEAARQTGVSVRTLKNWLAKPEFREALRQGRQQALESALSRLQGASDEAVNTLRRNLTCGNASVEVRAALGVIENAVRVSELLDLEDRVAALEKHNFK